MKGSCFHSRVAPRSSPGSMLALGTLAMSLLAASVSAQTNPAAQTLPYSQNFSGLPHASAAYPAGWQGWQDSTALPPTPQPSFSTGGPVADSPLLASSTASNTTGGVHNYNSKVGALWSGSGTRSLALAINTTDWKSVTVTYDIMTIRNPQDAANTRINEATLQYRVGTVGAWSTLSGIAYQNLGGAANNQTGAVTTPQNLQTRSVVLPAACENQSNVQLRWVQRHVSGAGGRPSFAVDSVRVTANPITTDLGVTFVCTADDSPKVCTNTVFTQQPWHALFRVRNFGQKAVDNWSFFIGITDGGGTFIPLKDQVPGPTIAVGSEIAINWPSPHIFTPTQKGPWILAIRVVVKDPTNPDSDPSNDQGSASFVVENKPVQPVSDIGVDFVCVTRADSLKACTDTLFTQQPWHTLFRVINKGQKPVDSWSFNITAFSGVPGQVFPLKTQVAGPPLPVGGSTTINWPSQLIFNPTQKGTWQVEVAVAVKDSTNPEPPALQGNNRRTVSFQVMNKTAQPVSDIGVDFVCVTRADSLKACNDTLFTQQPWHVFFRVINKGQKPVDNWSFFITLSNPSNPGIIPLKSQVAGPPLPLGGATTINWPSQFIFDATQKGPWRVEVAVSVKDSTNPEPVALTGNNRKLAPFEVVNKPVQPVSDIGIAAACVALADSAKTCSDTLFTHQPWHIKFTVINKGEKPVNDWSFGIILREPIAPGQSFVLKDQVTGPPLPVGGATTINWPSPFLFQPNHKGPWVVDVAVAVKEPDNPEPPPLQGNNRKSIPFDVVNKAAAVSDIGVPFACVTLNDSAKACRDTLFTQQPWHVLFRVINKGEKTIFNWSYNIRLINPNVPGQVFPIKTQVMGPPLPVGGGITINWPSQFIFDPTQKGPWQVVVTAAVKDTDNHEPPALQGNNSAADTFVVMNKPVDLVSDIGINAACVAFDDSLKTCSDTLFTQQPWHIKFGVVNKGEKPVDNWSFSIFLSQPGQPAIPLKQQVTGPPLQVGQVFRINWPSPFIFNPNHKGPWTVNIFVAVKDSTNPEPPDRVFNNRAVVQFHVVNKPEAVSDIGLNGLCVTLNDSAKTCRTTVFTQQQWHIKFRVINKGEKAVDNWSFQIELAGPNSEFVLKGQVPGPPLPVGGATIINWPSPYIFNASEKGPWKVTARVEVKDPSNPEPSALQGNNSASFPFTVENKPPTPVTDIGITTLCVMDSLKECTDIINTTQPWHVMFKVINKGEKSVDTWNFTISVTNALQSILVKDHVPGPPLPVGGQVGIQWLMPFEFGPNDKGPWRVDVLVTVKEPENPDTNQHNNHRFVDFTVRNKPQPVSDIGVDQLCVTDTLKACTDTLFNKLPWHILFRVLNKGQKAVDNWSFNIVLQRPGVTIPIKTQIQGPPLAVGEAVRINWESPHRFASEDKGPWQVVVVVEVKDPSNPEPPPLQGNNRMLKDFVVVNHPLTGADDPLPTELRLRNAPNPFAATTNILFDLPRDSHAELGVYDFSGRLVKRLLSGSLPAGSHTVIWDGVDDSGRLAPAGVYLYRLRIGGLNLTRRMVLMK